MKLKNTKLKNMKRKIIALALVAAVIGTGNGISTFGTTISAESQANIEATENGTKSTENTVETSEIGKQPEVVKEIKNERTENSNTYLMSNGSKKLEIFAEDIRYKENGKWVDYDTTLTGLTETDIQSLRERNVSGASYSYANARGNIKHYFADKVNEDTPVIMTKDDYEIRFAPVSDKVVLDIEEIESAVEGAVENEQSIVSIPDNVVESTLSNAVVTDNETVVSSNEADIASDVTVVSSNEADIASDVTVVSSNEADIASDVTDISSDVTNISSDETDISELSFAEINAENQAEIVYENAGGSIEYRYQSLTRGVKESIVLNEKPDTNVFDFTLELGGMVAEVSEATNEIYLKDEGTDKVVAVIAPPNIIDETDIPDYDHVEYKLTEPADGGYRLSVVVDSEYLEGAVYPIIIDPTYMWVSESMLEYRPTMSVGGAASSVINGENGVTIMNSESNKARMYVRFKGLNEQLLGKYVYQSYFTTYTKSTNGDVTVGVSRVLGDWDVSTLTYKTQPDISDTMYDEEGGFVAESSNSFILTEWAKEIAAGEITDDYGIALSCADEANASVCLYSPYETNKQGFLYVYYQDVVDVNADYDGTFAVNMETTETNQVKLTWEAYSEETDEYDVYVRTDSSFVYVGNTTGLEYVLDSELLGDCTDVRVVAISAEDVTNLFYADICLSNVVTIQRFTDVVVDETGTETTEVYYEQSVMDTDGDGLEDGYEIWDFKTLWNSVVVDETEEEAGTVSQMGDVTEAVTEGEAEVVYDLDSDDDGFPDSYEVFILGTDPAVANEANANSDTDTLTDLEECQKGTDPWIANSDFDEYEDDAESKADARKTKDFTKQADAAAAQVHIGLYDRQYSETEDGVTYTYIVNIYRGDIKQITYDYGDVSLNKTLKYFYDERGNNTAIIEQYDASVDTNNKNLICITYTYDENDNVTFICDQTTQYTMDYDSNGEMSSLKVGNQELIAYSTQNIINNAGEDGDTSLLAVGDVIDKTENVTTYGNGDKARIVTTVYKVAEDDVTSAETVEEIYYDGSETLSYKTEYTSEGNVKAFYDYTKDLDNPVVYTYIYTDNGTSVTRSDDFTKTVLVSEAEEVETTEGTDEGESAEGTDQEGAIEGNGTAESTDEQEETASTSTTTTTYGFKDVKNNAITYSTVVTADMGSDNLVENKAVLYNGDISNYVYNSEAEVLSGNIYSTLYDKEIVKTTQTVNSNTSTSYEIDIYAEDKSIDYTYDLTGNIVEIKINDVVSYKYTYDAHGRLTSETDIGDGKYHQYLYGDTGNISAHKIYELDAEGNKSSTLISEVYSDYTDTDWPDQLSAYDDKPITYDDSGNPLTYLDEMSFEWNRGRQLTSIDFLSGSSVSEEAENTEAEESHDVEYEYNKDGLRTYKKTADTTTTYEWDEATLIRETVTYNVTNKTYDIWYLYDSNGCVVGFEYSYVNDVNDKSSVRIYYEKDLQGNVIGLLDSRGAEIATYSYDAWGNVTDSMCYEGYEVPFALNHISYRGYYRDDETGFYYLQSRYYDPEICRFVNADDVSVINISISNVFNDNLYLYCNSNPIMYKDPSGYIAVVDDVVFWGIVLAVTTAIMLVSFVSAYQFHQYSQSYYSAMTRVLNQTWNRFIILFKTATQVVNKAIEKSLAKATEVVRTKRNRDYYWIASKVTYRRKNVNKTTYFPSMPISKASAVIYSRSGGDVFASTQSAARRLAYTVGHGAAPIGPERHGTIGFFWHYHANRHKSGHIFYL